jgi:hypothetical protein
MSIPKIGATDFGYRVAKQFDLPVVTPRPALVPLTFDEAAWAPFSQLSGLSLPVSIETGGKKDKRLSSKTCCSPPRPLRPRRTANFQLLAGRHAYPPEPGARHRHRRPPEPGQSHLAQADCQRTGGPGALPLGRHLGRPGRGHNWQRPINEASDKAPTAGRAPDAGTHPTGTEGYRKAEVTAGGVDTKALSSQTLESRQPGLYFIGEVVDVTGWLGGYNSSGPGRAHLLAQGARPGLRAAQGSAPTPSLPY